MRQITTAMASSMKKRSEAVTTPAEVGTRPVQWAIGQPAQHLRTARVLMLKASIVKSVVGAEFVSENAEEACGPSGVLAMRLKLNVYPERKNVVPAARVGRKHAAAQQNVAGVTGNRAQMKASVSLERPARLDKPNAWNYKPSATINANGPRIVAKPGRPHVRRQEPLRPRRAVTAVFEPGPVRTAVHGLNGQAVMVKAYAALTLRKPMYAMPAALSEFGPAVTNVNGSTSASVVLEGNALPAL